MYVAKRERTARNSDNFDLQRIPQRSNNLKIILAKTCIANGLYVAARTHSAPIIIIMKIILAKTCIANNRLFVAARTDLIAQTKRLKKKYKNGGIERMYTKYQKTTRSPPGWLYGGPQRDQKNKKTFPKAAQSRVSCPFLARFGSGSGLRSGSGLGLGLGLALALALALGGGFGLRPAPGPLFDQEVLSASKRERPTALKIR